MKNEPKGLLICSGKGKTKNIGDFIQSVAAEQYNDVTDCYIERENLKQFSSEVRTKCILCGWFMHNPENWPPSDSIDPLVISFHIVPKIADRMLTKEGIAWLKKHEPIGCRDTGTAVLLQENGISAYFSGCITLTLGKKYPGKRNRTGVIFVDPYYEVYQTAEGKGSIRLLLCNVLYGLFHLLKIRKQMKNIAFEERGFFVKYKKLNKFLNASAFYRSYSSKFSDEVLFNSTFVTHSVKQENFGSDTEKMDYARKLLKLYGGGKYVVTSRIHCALPCLGIETPVIFVTSENLESKTNPIRSAGRFGGLMELFRVMKYEQNHISTDDVVLKNDNRKITGTFNFDNKNDYKALRDKLINSCENFFAE